MRKKLLREENILQRKSQHFQILAKCFANIFAKMFVVRMQVLVKKALWYQTEHTDIVLNEILTKEK
jgi:hypothetical protein